MTAPGVGGGHEWHGGKMLSFCKKAEEVFDTAHSLIGQKINKVEYYGLRIISEEIDSDYNVISQEFSNYKTKYNNIHSFEIALSIYMESGDIYDIIWDNIFYCYGLRIIKNDHEEYENVAVKKWIMTEDSIWKKCINNEITNICILWETNYESYEILPNGEKRKVENKNEENWNPITCLINFREPRNKRNSIIVSTSGFIGKNEEMLFKGHDNILVTDNYETAVYIGII